MGMLTLGDIQAKMGKLKDWSLESSAISKEFGFGSFSAALEFVNKVAEIAEAEQHHPDIFLSGVKVRLILTTHSEKGLTEKDFSIAEKIDRL
tara:strand:+ start:5629 stop:5904 length:276 start_codon:yes stop_codon:yes gene_type:complete